MTWVFVVVGVAFNVVVVFDVVTTLFTSSGRAGYSQRLARRFWQLMAPALRKSRFVRAVAGPATFVAVVISWVGVTVIGWALIYFPFLPDSFLTDFGVERDRSASTFVTAIYFSMASMTTLGFGDIVPSTESLRIIVPLEGFLGLGLLTAGVSWFLSIDPVLSRRRTLAHHATLLREAGGVGTGLTLWGQQSQEQILHDLAAQTIAIRADLAQYPVTYFFRDADERTNLAVKLPFLIQIAGDEQRDLPDRHCGVQGSAAVLEAAIDDYLAMVSVQFLGISDAAREDILGRYLREHR